MLLCKARQLDGLSNNSRVGIVDFDGVCDVGLVADAGEEAKEAKVVSVKVYQSSLPPAFVVGGGIL